MITINDIPKLQSVKPLVGYKLELTYSNGFLGIYDINNLFKYDVFKPLQNVDLFNKVHKSYSAVVWNEEIDLCGDSIYLELTNEKLSDNA